MKHINTFDGFLGKATSPSSYPNETNPVNESISSLTIFYSDSDKDVKEVAKEIDGIIDRAGFNINTKNELLTLITDLTDAYLVAMRNA